MYMQVSHIIGSHFAPSIILTWRCCRSCSQENPNQPQTLGTTTAVSFVVVGGSASHGEWVNLNMIDILSCQAPLISWLTLDQIPQFTACCNQWVNKQSIGLLFIAPLWRVWQQGTAAAVPKRCRRVPPGLAKQQFGSRIIIHLMSSIDHHTVGVQQPPQTPSLGSYHLQVDKLSPCFCSLVPHGVDHLSSWLYHHRCDRRAEWNQPSRMGDDFRRLASRGEVIGIESNLQHYIVIYTTLYYSNLIYLSLRTLGLPEITQIAAWQSPRTTW